jgi:predicted permease
MLLLRVAGLLGRRHIDRQGEELDREIAEHLALLAERYERQGASPREALRAARRQFGSVAALRDSCRAQRGLPGIEAWWRDVRHALRIFRRNPGFAAVAAGILALGLGSSTAIFSAVDAVLWKQLPFPASGRLVWAWAAAPSGSSRAAVSPPDFRDLRARSRSFAELAAIAVSDVELTLAGGAAPRQVTTAVVSANLFRALALAPALGRSFLPADEDAAWPEVAVLGQAAWRRDFGADPGVVGRKLTLDGHALTVVGVLPRDVPLLSRAEVWVPAPMRAPGMKERKAHFLRLVGRLQPGLGLAAAQAEADAIARDLAAAYPATDAGWGLRLEPLREALVGPVRPTLLMLFGAVGLLLLIACANVANLLLARMTGRQQEIGVRMALGAGPGRLLRQLLVESLLLALAGGAAGVILARWGVAGLRALAPADLPRAGEVQIDGTVLLFALGTALGAAIVFGLAPAAWAIRGGWQRAAHGGWHASAPRAKRRVGLGLVVAEIALSFLLLVASGLLLMSLRRLLLVDPGFRPVHVVTARLALPEAAYRQEWRRTAFVRRLLARLAALPGVTAAGAISELPLADQPNDTYFRVAGRSYATGRSDHADFRVVAGAYFQALGIPLLAGRRFGDGDDARAAGAVIVNEPFRERYFPGKSPLGRHLIVWEGSDRLREIVGVVGGVRDSSLQSPPQPEIYVPYAQQPGRLTMSLTVRATLPTRQLAGPVAAAVRALDPGQAVAEVRAMDDLVSGAAAGPRFAGLLVGCFGLAALLLTAVGLYGVISHAAGQRRQELGIRAALGARRRDLVLLVAAQGAGAAFLGLALGGAASPALTRLLRGLLFGVGPYDPEAFAAAAVIILAVAMLACLAPAWRAARLDPLAALRYE